MLRFLLFVSYLACWNTYAANCEAMLLPRRLDAGATFDKIVTWVHDELIVARRAPGLVVGISGTDSVVAFLAAAEAFARTGRPERAVGVHFADPSVPSWFTEEVIPWLHNQAPGARVLIDGSIDHRRDGLRWGALVEWSVVENVLTGHLRAPEERFWLTGTRNRTESMLGTYSNASIAASVQPLVQLWKSEILDICRTLNVPPRAITESCTADCACGRDQLPALHIPEVDALLMERAGELGPEYARATIPPEIRKVLNKYIDEQLSATSFKSQIPYVPDGRGPIVASERSDLSAPVGLPELIGGGDLAQVGLVAARWAAALEPEALPLLNTVGLRSTQLRAILSEIFNGIDLDVPADQTPRPVSRSNRILRI